MGKMMKVMKVSMGGLWWKVKLVMVRIKRSVLVWRVMEENNGQGEYLKKKKVKIMQAFSPPPLVLIFFLYLYSCKYF